MSKISIRPEVRRPPGPSRCSGRSTGEDLLAGWDRLPRVRDRWADTPSRTVRTEISNRIPSSGPKDGPRLHARNRASPPSGLGTWYSERFPARHRRTEGCGESVARGPLSLPSRLGLRDPRPTTSALDSENFPARRGPTDGCGESAGRGPLTPCTGLRDPRPTTDDLPRTGTSDRCRTLRTWESGPGAQASGPRDLRLGLRKFSASARMRGVGPSRAPDPMHGAPRPATDDRRPPEDRDL